MRYFNKKFIVISVLILLLWGMCSCTKPEGQKEPPKTCEHTYSDKWEYDEKQHFHRATCEHKDLIKDEELHKFTSWEKLENGKEEARKCEICDYIEKRAYEPAPHQHTYGEWTLEKEPTLDETGLLKRVCKEDANHIDEKELPKLNGQSYAYKVETPSTCSSKGEASYSYDMGEKIFKFIVELEYASHSYGKWEMIKTPTLTTPGLLERVCSSNASHKESFELPILNENDYEYTTIPVGCFTDGKDIYGYQKDQEKFEIELPILSKGHPYELKQDAYKHWLASNCEHHLKKEIQDHTYVDGICSVCKYEQKEDNAVIYELNQNESGYNAVINPDYKGNSIVILDTYLDLPVVELNKSSFDGKDIVSITLPSSLKIIENDTFVGFDKLEDVFYDGTILDWCNISFGSKTASPMHLAKTFYQREADYWEETTKIDVPNGVRTIGKYQFYGFKNITELTLPATLDFIYDGAFGECSSLTELIIPDFVLTIGKDILALTKLKKLTIPFLSGKSSYNDSYIGYYFGFTTRNVDGLWNHDRVEALSALEELTLTRQTRLPDYALSNLKSLKKLSLPDTLIELGKTGIYGCSALEFNEFENGYYLGNALNPYLLLVSMIDKTATTFTLASQTKLIYEAAFKNALITEIEIPATVVEIGNEAFSGSALTCIELPESITHLNANTFSNCLALEEVTLPVGLTNIDSQAFTNTPIKKATLNLEATLILNESLVEDLTILSGEGTLSLALYPQLKRVQLTENITDLGSNVITGCPNLEYTVDEFNIAYLGNEENPYIWLMYAKDKMIEEIQLPYDTYYIYENAFKDCTQLLGVRILDRVLKIEEYAFSNCQNLSYVYFGSYFTSLKRIEANAFENCISLFNISFPSSLTFLGRSILYGCTQLRSLTLPFIGEQPNLTAASEKTLFGWIFGRFSSSDTITLSQRYKQGGSIITANLPKTLKEITITGGKIYNRAFSDVKDNIEKLTISKDVQFSSSLEEFYPKYIITNYTSLAYLKKSFIEELTITDDVDEFNLDCSSYYYFRLKKLSFVGLKKISANGSLVTNQLSHIDLPDNLEEINDKVFKYSNQLVSLVLPKGIKRIGTQAFYQETSLYYLGTEEEWNLVEKESLENPVYFYSETKITNGWHYVDDVPTLW